MRSGKVEEADFDVESIRLKLRGLTCLQVIDVRTGSDGRIAAKCVPERPPVTVNCRITETRSWRETVRKALVRLQLLGQLALSQKLEDRRGCGGLADEASNEGLVSGSSGEF